MSNLSLVEEISYRHFLRAEIKRAGAEILSMRTATTSTLYSKWARQEVIAAFLEANLGRFLKGLPSKVLDTLGGGAVKAWEGVRGKIQKFVELFKNPKIIQALTSFIGDVTPKNIQKFVEDGKTALKKVFSGIKMILTTPSERTTLTDLIKRTAIGAGISEWFNDKVKPRADAVDEWLKKHAPRLKRVVVAAIFAFIWFNVDELSWEWSGLVAGFTGALSIAELLASLPEAAIGLVTGRLFGVGFVIMPYMILGRILWLAGKKYLIWDGKSWIPNLRLVDPAAF